MRLTYLLPISCAGALACGDELTPATDETGSSTSASAPTSTTESSVTESSGSSSDDGSAPDGSSSHDPTDPSSSSAGPFDAPPQVLDDLYRTPMDGELVVEAADGLFANDVDPEAISLELVAADDQSARGGIVSVAVDGAFTYTPPAGIWGPDTFGYTAVDAAGAMASAVATINVLPVEIPLATIAAGEGGFIIDGIPWSYSVESSAGAGDVNGDGLADLVFGTTLGGSSGQAHIVFGKPDHDVVEISATDIGDGGFRIDGSPLGSLAGWAVGGAGDVNGDGLADVVVADPGTGLYPYTVSGYVVFGKDDGEPVPLGSIAAGSYGFVMTGTALPTDWSIGRQMSIGGAGDVNGDGLDDLVIGICVAPDTGLARTWVVFGKVDTDPIDLDAVSAGIGGFVLEGESDNPGHYRRWVSAAGDVNGDGADDIVIGAHSFALDGVSNAGRSYVVFGKADTAPIDLAAIALGDGGFVVDGDAESRGVGAAVANAGDVDGDGLDDVIIGVPGIGDGGGGVVVFGKANTDPVRVADIVSGSGGFAILAETSIYAGAGATVAGGGDIDGDGLADVIVGAPWVATPNGALGRAYVVYGKSDTDVVALVDAPDGSLGFILDSELPGDQTAVMVDVAGDVDGDGLADLLVPSQIHGVFDTNGRAYVMFGTSTAPKP